MGYRPITDCWLMARSKVKYYGAYPAGFLERARALLGVHITDPVLHVCGGKIRLYPYPKRGLGPNDRTVDFDARLVPDFVVDVRAGIPRFEPICTRPVSTWAAVLIDRPYSEADAEHYAPGSSMLPNLNKLLKDALAVVQVGGRVGILDYKWPRPPRVGGVPAAIEVAAIAVTTGRDSNMRVYTVWERLV